MSEMSDPSAPPGVPVCYRHPGRETHIRCQRCNRPICPDCMREASVGFQCPECVAEGARTTRAARTTYGGLRPGNAGITSMALIAVNVGVWLAILVTGGGSSRLLAHLQLIPVGQCRPPGGRGFYPSVGSADVCSSVPGATWVAGVADGAWWQLITSAFTHEAVLHIGFNMLALYVLGPQLEMVLGRARYLALYLLSALAGSALVYWAAPQTQGTLGASGAIFGLMGALLVVALKMRVNPQQVLMWIGINFVLTFTISNISWQGHLGGFLGGVACAAVLVYAPRQRRTASQVAGLVLIGAVIAVAILARTAVLA